jgi:hypothetical protein
MARVTVMLASALILVAAVGRGQQQQPIRLSVMQLTTNPEKYDGKLVSAVGYLCFGYEGDGLYLHKEDYENGIEANGINVDRTRQMLQDREKLYDNYVVIVGVFRRQQLSPAYISTGRITNVQKCQLWSQPDHPVAERLKGLRSQGPKERQ